MSYLILALLIIAVAFLWTIAQELQDIVNILRIAHADALVVSKPPKNYYSSICPLVLLVDTDEALAFLLK